MTPAASSGTDLRVEGDTELARAVAAHGLVRPSDLLGPLVFIDFSTDAETAGAIPANLASDAIVVAQIRRAQLRRAILDRLVANGHGSRVVLFDLGSTLVADTIAKQRLYDQAWWRGQSRLHAVVAGFGDLGHACLQECVMAGIAGDLALPRITILDPNPAAVEAWLTTEMPEIRRSAEVVVVGLGANDTIADKVTAAECDSPLTAVLLCLGDDEAQALALLALDRLRGSRRGLAPVFALSEKAMPLTALACPPGRPHDLARQSSVRCGWPGSVETLLLTTSAEDAVARRMHESYRCTYGGVAGSLAAWEDLPESFRAANRRGARHLGQKLWTLGITWFGSAADPGAVAPEPYASVVEPCLQGVFEDAPVRRLARLEHDRWCADRRLDGWAFGVARDDARRLHPSLVPFDDPQLTSAEIDKDIGQIRFTLANNVRPVDGGATAPLVVGVVAGSSAKAGIEMADALTLSADEPWRPVVILTALADPKVVAATIELLGELRRERRLVRLLIVERQFGEPCESRIGADGLAALVPGMDDDVSIVTVQAGDPTDAGWHDPGASSVEDDFLADFIASRAAAVVVCRIDA